MVAPQINFSENLKGYIESFNNEYDMRNDIMLGRQTDTNNTTNGVLGGKKLYVGLSNDNVIIKAGEVDEENNIINLSEEESTKIITSAIEELKKCYNAESIGLEFNYELQRFILLPADRDKGDINEVVKDIKLTMGFFNIILRDGISNIRGALTSTYGDSFVETLENMYAPLFVTEGSMSTESICKSEMLDRIEDLWIKSNNYTDSKEKRYKKMVSALGLPIVKQVRYRNLPGVKNKRYWAMIPIGLDIAGTKSMSELLNKVLIGGM